jgi:NAD(P)H-dependent flavin oxidoreductase YrpB (nitropropane dioxygenase family)
MEKLDLVLDRGVRIVASGLGPLPLEISRRIHDKGGLYVGMTGDPRHVERHLESEVDIIVAQGMEAGGHVGKISTFCLVPQVVDRAGDVPVLAAGGVAGGRHLAAALALGAQGVWTGSIWLTTRETDVPEPVVQKLLRASSTDAVVTRVPSGKTSRQLRTPFLDAWEEDGAPKPLPAPLQGMLVNEARRAIVEHDVVDVMGTAVGQVVGMMDRVKSSRDVVYQMVEEYVAVLEMFVRSAELEATSDR